MKNIFLSLILVTFGISVNAQFSGAQLPVNKNWYSAKFSVAVTTPFPEEYQSQVVVIPVGDSVPISGEIKTFSGIGLKANSISGLEPSTEYSYEHTFSKDTLRRVFAGSFKTDPLPPRPTITIVEEPFQGISDLLIIIESSYPVRVWGFYDGDTETETYLHQGGLDTVIMPLVTPVARKYPYCVVFSWSDSVGTDQDSVICDEILVTVPPKMPAPDITFQGKNADCGEIEITTRIYPISGDTSAIRLYISDDQVNYFLVDSAVGLYWPITIVTRIPGLDGGRKYYVKAIGVSKDSLSKEISTNITMPDGESPTIAITPKVIQRLVEFNYAGWGGCSGSTLELRITGNSETIDTVLFLGADQYVGAVDFFLNPGNYSWRAAIENRYGQQTRSGNFIVSDTATVLNLYEVEKIPPNTSVWVLDTSGRTVAETVWSEVYPNKNPFRLEGLYLLLIPNSNYVEKRLFLR